MSRTIYYATGDAYRWTLGCETAAEMEVAEHAHTEALTRGLAGLPYAVTSHAVYGGAPAWGSRNRGVYDDGLASTYSTDAALHDVLRAAYQAAERAVEQDRAEAAR